MLASQVASGCQPERRPRLRRLPAGPRPALAGGAMTLLGLLESEILVNDHDEPYAWRLAPARTDRDPEASGAVAPEQKAPARCSSTLAFRSQ